MPSRTLKTNLDKSGKKQSRRRTMGEYSFNYGLVEIPVNRRIAGGGSGSGSGGSNTWPYLPLHH